MVEQWSPKPKVKGSNPFSPDWTTRIQSPFWQGRLSAIASEVVRTKLLGPVLDGVH